MYVIAHRGYRKRYPEHTMLAFQKALEAGCDAMEIDVQLTKDGIPVLFHDEKLDALTTGKGLLSETSYEELRPLRIKKVHWGKRYKEPLVTLESYFQWVKTTPLFTVIELKYYPSSKEGLEEAVLKLIASFDLSHWVILSSFHWPALEILHSLTPDLQKAWIFAPLKKGSFQNPSPLPLDFYHVKHTAMRKYHWQFAKDNALKLTLWTVNCPLLWQRYLKRDLFGLITDDPHNLKKTMKRKGL